MIIKKTGLTLFFLLSLMIVSGQEFLCSVQVTSRQVEGTDKSIYEEMQRNLFEFINNRRWSPYSFKNEERIECSLVINITERPSTDVFKGTLAVVARRPVYKTTYFTTLINHIDKDFEFEYVMQQSLDYDDNTFNSNLTSVVAYYLYIILGLDFDSFALNGGTPFFQKAEAVVNAAQNARESGWKAYENQKNRYWLVQTLLDNTLTPLRKFSYEYHRKGLDVMSEKVDIGRSHINENLKLLKQVYDEDPYAFAFIIFLDAKRDELVNIFMEGTPPEKTNVINIFKEIDPANSSKYTKITGQQ